MVDYKKIDEIFGPPLNEVFKTITKKKDMKKSKEDTLKYRIVMNVYDSGCDMNITNGIFGEMELNYFELIGVFERQKHRIMEMQEKMDKIQSKIKKGKNGKSN